MNVHDDLYFLADSKGFLWASERDGYAHLYLYALDGTLIRQITKGEWALRASSGLYWMRQTVPAIDEENGWIYFTALEKSSIERHLYRIRFDGSGMERLTPDDGTHSVTFSPDARWFFDRHSSRTLPPSLTLRRADGAVAYTLAESRKQLAEQLGLRPAASITVPAGDGYPMPGYLLRPKNFDSSKKYPLILYVYGGPSAPAVSNVWSSSQYFDHLLSERGYLVARVDNRSATARSKKLENSILHHGWGKGELADLLAAVKWLKAKPWVNGDRVGIWGWSGGWHVHASGDDRLDGVQGWHRRGRSHRLGVLRYEVR